MAGPYLVGMKTRLPEALKARFEADVLSVLIRESGSCAISYLRTSLERSGGGSNHGSEIR